MPADNAPPAGGALEAPEEAPDEWLHSPEESSYTRMQPCQRHARMRCPGAVGGSWFLPRNLADPCSASPFEGHNLSVD